MGKVTGPSWAGSSVYISFNKNKDLGARDHAQQWSIPKLLLDRPGYFMVSSLQPLNTEEDVKKRYTCMNLGKRARLFIKFIKPEKSIYASAHLIEFEKKSFSVSPHMKRLFLFLLLHATLCASAQTNSVTVSGVVRNTGTRTGLPFVTVGLKLTSGSETRTITNEEGRFSISGITPGDYRIQLSYTGFETLSKPVLVGKLSSFLDLGIFELHQTPHF